MKKITTILLLVILVFSFSGCFRSKTENYAASLEVWGVFDDSDFYNEIFRNYRQINPHVRNIEYKKFSVETYKKELLEALAAGNGPDIFMINNTWLPQFKETVIPATEEMVPFQTFKDAFVDTVVSDFSINEQVYGAPMSVDSLALFYNKDLLNEAGIANPPTDWKQFNEQVKLLTKIDNYGEITQAGAAIGTAYNINRSTDILSMLMLQNGAQMVDMEQGMATFNEGVNLDGKLINPGQNALEFYTQFANTGSLVYTWNPRLHYSIDSFYEGKLAMMFNYSWHIPTIKSKAPRINFDVAPVPQLENGKQITISNYWGWVAVKNKNAPTGRDQVALDNELRQKEAWNLIKYMTLGTYQVSEEQTISHDSTEKYLELTKKPAARRDLIEKQKSDPELGVFAKQNLIARNWHQKDVENTERTLAEVIDQVNKGSLAPSDAIDLAAQRITNLLRN